MMIKQRKNNTFDTLFGDLLKTLQILSEKEMNSFQSQLYKNTLNAALEAKIIKENPFEKAVRAYGSYRNEKAKPLHPPYETIDTTPKHELENPDLDPEATKKYQEYPEK